jgi:hypothetical protein
METIIDELNENTLDRAQLQRWSDEIIKTWHESGKLALSARVTDYTVGSLRDAYDLYWDGDVDLTDHLDELNEEWLRALGFADVTDPVSFPYAGNGDTVWLTEFMSKDFTTWLQEATA